MQRSINGCSDSAGEGVLELGDLKSTIAGA